MKMTVGSITQLTTNKGLLPKQITALPPVRSEPLLDALWAFLCDCENAGDRTRKTALETFNQGYGEGEYQLARDVKHRMVILGYKPARERMGEL